MIYSDWEVESASDDRIVLRRKSVGAGGILVFDLSMPLSIYHRKLDLYCYNCRYCYCMRYYLFHNLC
jgi:hypothetical protein